MTPETELKEKYLQTLQEYVEEPLYITDRIDEFQKEFDSNCWFINGSKEQIQSLDLKEWTAYLNHLISDRQRQLDRSNIKTDLLMYFWHDELAGQLRFNVVTAKHPKLPLACTYINVPIETLLARFIGNDSPGVIPFSKLEVVEGSSTVSLGASGQADDDFVAEVSVIQIKKGSGSSKIEEEPRLDG